jgi:hypothetical protein
MLARLKNLNPISDIHKRFLSSICVFAKTRVFNNAVHAHIAQSRRIRLNKLDRNCESVLMITL